MINCATLNWFMDWPKEALIDVANKFLSDLQGFFFTFWRK